MQSRFPKCPKCNKTKQTKNTSYQHPKNKNLNLDEKKTNRCHHIRLFYMLELSDKNFKAAIIEILS